MNTPHHARPLIALGLLVTFLAGGTLDAAEISIVIPQDASPIEQLAAREVRRYTWLRTGELLPIHKAAALPRDGNLIVVARESRGLVHLPPHTGPALGDDGFRLRSIADGNRKILALTGTRDLGSLYAAYRFAEHLGVRFYLHGDVLPDGHVPLKIPDLDEVQRPLFELRGIQPFHDFPEGPDWWNRDDYRSVISQLPKLRMNFFALHTYPEARPNAEPTVWIGQPGDAEPSGHVKFAYPSSYQNTRRGNWGYQSKPTSAFTHGSSALFEHDDFGPSVMDGFCPEPAEPAGFEAVFNRTGDLLRDAFTHARGVGVKTCVGTETPLIVPRRVAERLKSQGLNPEDPATLQRLYEGIFSRAAAAYPLDYYWFWTPEGWTWEGTQGAQVRATTNDLAAAIAAHAAVHAPFQLATCGWVLGPAQDRALFDKILPKEIAVSCINREVGRTPVEPGFAEVQGRGKWAIPWMEDDPALTSVQLWAGRMRRDAADALDYKCGGLMGIHWRTRVLGPAVAALAQAAWDQSPWRDDLRRRRGETSPDPKGVVIGGRPASFTGHEIADTDDDTVYQTVRYDLTAYRVPFANGKCRVTLRFCEPHYREAGKRVFDVSINGRRVAENLDVFARVGLDRALDLAFDDVSITNGVLEVRFTPKTEYPSIAGLSIEGPAGSRHIDCGGPGAGKFEADLHEEIGPSNVFADTTDFYRDWATAEFGASVAGPAAEIFARIDGHLPRPSDWTDGPGGLKPDPRNWAEVQREYVFVDQFAALTPKVSGPAQSARFAWWLDTFRYHRAIGELDCQWAVFQKTLVAATNSATATPADRERALAARRGMVRITGEIYSHLLATVSNPGELGTLANWEQHILPSVFGATDDAVRRLAGGTAPTGSTLPMAYHGPTRLIVPTAPTSLPASEAPEIRILVLSENTPGNVSVFSREMGQGRFAGHAAQQVGRGVYSVRLPKPGPKTEDLEWYAEATDASGLKTRWPATAPGTGHTVVIEPD